MINNSNNNNNDVSNAININSPISNKSINNRDNLFSPISNKSKNNEGNISTDILKDLRVKCIKNNHNSQVVGVCSELFCQETMICVKDLSSSNCINSNQHKLMLIPDFVNNFFNQKYIEYKKDTILSRNLISSESYLKDSEKIMDNFIKKSEAIYNFFSEKLQEISNNLNDLMNNFLNELKKKLDDSQEELKKGLFDLDECINFRRLDSFDINKIKKKMLKMKYNPLEDLFKNMKKTIKNLTIKSNFQYNEIISHMNNLIDINNEDADLKNDFESNFINLFNSNINSFFGSLSSTINESLFRKKKTDEKLVENLIKIYDMPIDYSTNSNFTDKKVVLFSDDNDSKFYLAYPTSLNRIKVEDFTNNISPSVINYNLELTIKDSPKKDKDKYNKNKLSYLSEYTLKDTNINNNNNKLSGPLEHISKESFNKDENIINNYYYKLSGHEKKILDIKYYNYDNKKYLITTSEDKLIKIWDITQYHINNHPYNNNNEKCVILKGHINPVLSFDIFFDNSKKFIVSTAYNDIIRIWDFVEGKTLKKIKDNDMQYKNSYEKYLKIYKINNINYLITFCINNDNKQVIKIWNFDKEEVIQRIDYHSELTFSFTSFMGKNNPDYDKIIQFELFQKENKILVIDKLGSCGIISFSDENNENFFELINMKLISNSHIRSRIVFYTDDIILICTNNGLIIEYSLEENKIISHIKISEKNISYCQVVDFKDEMQQKRKIILVHCEDQSIKILAENNNNLYE